MPKESMTTIEEFNDLLKLRARSFSEIGKEVGEKPGLKLLILSGELIRHLLLNDSTSSYLEALEMGLPKDYCFLDHDGQLIRWHPNLYTSTGTHTEEYSILVASREWPPYVEGSRLEVFDVRLKRLLKENTD